MDPSSALTAGTTARAQGPRLSVSVAEASGRAADGRSPQSPQPSSCCPMRGDTCPRGPQRAIQTASPETTSGGPGLTERGCAGWGDGWGWVPGLWRGSKPPGCLQGRVSRVFLTPTWSIGSQALATGARAPRAPLCGSGGGGVCGKAIPPAAWGGQCPAWFPPAPLLPPQDQHSVRSAGR